MNIDLLSKMIKELILDNDKVVLPGLGTFVAEIVPSAFTDKGYTVTPPYRRLYFRARPDEGNLLVEFYARTNRLDNDVSERIIREFISELKSILHVKKTVIFPGLGRLRATKENAVFFIADEELDIYPEGFGLESISLKSHSRECADEIPSEPESVPEIPADVIEEHVIEDEVIDVMPVEGTEEMQLPEEETAAPGNNVTEEVTIVEEPADVKSPLRVLKVLLWTILVAVLLLVAFVVVARLYPGVFDSILYAPDELEIIDGL